MDATVEILLTRVREAVKQHTKLIQACRKRLKKADSRATADTILRELDMLTGSLDELKIQYKALKRGVIPDALKE
jgi:predicted  nucleic acid-binding Zn-ribbon protein